MLLSGLRSGFRTLAAAPLHTALAIAALALGVGANAAIFSAVRGMLLTPLPYAEPDRLVQVWTGHVASPELFSLVEEQLTQVEHLDASTTVSLALVGEAEAWEIPAGQVTGAHFPMLAETADLGRVLTREDQRPGAEPVVVLSHGLWQSRFGGDPGVLGRQVQLGDAQHPSRSVVGVMAPGHRPLEPSWQAWIPVLLDPSQEELWSHHYGLRMHARLAAGADLGSATAELRGLTRRLDVEREDLFVRNAESAEVARLLDVIVGDLRGQLLLLLGAVALVLLVACADVANLLLTRGLARQRELAIRTALGATRGRLARQLLGESALLGLLGGGAGLLLADWLVSLLRVLPLELPRLETVRVDAAVLAWALGTGLASSLLAGLLPALETTRGELQGALADGGRGGAGAGRQRLQAALVMAEVALAVTLVVSAGLLLRSAWRLQRVDPGFEYQSVLALRLNPPPARYATPHEVLGYYARVMERIRRVPGVERVGATSLLPLAGGRSGVAFDLDGQQPPPGERSPTADYAVVSGEFFQALRVPLLQGAWAGPSAPDAPRPVDAMVNRAFAERFLSGQDPLGHRLTGDGEEWLRIVGVVGDVRQRQLDATPQPRIYVPHAHEPMPRLYLAVRSQGDPARLQGAVGAAVAEVDPLVPVTRFAPMSGVVSSSLARSRLFMALLVGFASLALALGAVGIYGVVSYGVSQRTREIGVRMALGASRSEVLGAVLRDGLRPVALGLLVGLLLATGVGRLLAAQLYEVPALDPWTFGAVALGVLLVGAGAALGPAQRAASLDPIRALRAD